MLLRLILKPALILIALGAGVIGVLRSQLADDHLSSLIVPSCAAPCWQGIEIGVTTREQATQLLQASQWVARIYQTDETVIWDWNGQQPPEISGDKEGLLQIGGDVVRQIRIQTAIPFGAIWLLLGRPDDALLVRPLSLQSGYQIADYPVGVQAISEVDCPITPAEFWTAPVTLGLGAIWSTEALNGRDFNIYHTPAWWRLVRYC